MVAFSPHVLQTKIRCLGGGKKWWFFLGRGSRVNQDSRDIDKNVINNPRLEYFKEPTFIRKGYIADEMLMGASNNCFLLLIQSINLLGV